MPISVPTALMDKEEMGIDQVARITAATTYDTLFPYHAELCALTELRKKPGFGARLHSGIGGHILLYLSGVRLDRAAGYPVLRLCTADEPPDYWNQMGYSKYDGL